VSVKIISSYSNTNHYYWNNLYECLILFQERVNLPPDPTKTIRHCSIWSAPRNDFQERVTPSPAPENHF
jgi:hypothetical protein